MAIEVSEHGAISISGPRDMHLFRLHTLLSGLRFEVDCPGMKISRVSAYSVAKKEFGLKGNKANVLAQLEKIVEEAAKMRNLSAQEEQNQATAAVQAAVRPNNN